MEDDEDQDMNVYSDDSRENLMKDDEISPEQEAFMKGYEEADESDDDDDDSDYDKAFD